MYTPVYERRGTHDLYIVLGDIRADDTSKTSYVVSFLHQCTPVTLLSAEQHRQSSPAGRVSRALALTSVQRNEQHRPEAYHFEEALRHVQANADRLDAEHQARPGCARSIYLSELDLGCCWTHEERYSEQLSRVLRERLQMLAVRDAFIAGSTQGC